MADGAMGCAFIICSGCFNANENFPRSPAVDSIAGCEESCRSQVEVARVVPGLVRGAARIL